VVQREIERASFLRELSRMCELDGLRNFRLKITFVAREVSNPGNREPDQLLLQP
jgi:hypothetical protein